MNRLLVKTLGTLVFYVLFPFMAMQILIEILIQSIRCKWEEILYALNLKEERIMASSTKPSDKLNEQKGHDEGVSLSVRCNWAKPKR